MSPTQTKSTIGWETSLSPRTGTYILFNGVQSQGFFFTPGTNDGNDDCDDHGDNAGDDAGFFSSAQVYLMQNNSNDDADDKQPLLNHSCQSDDGIVMNHCINVHVLHEQLYIRHHCCVYGNLLQTSCVTKQRKMKTSM